MTLASAVTLVPAAERAMKIFEAFERTSQPLTLSRIAEELEAPISSCHNLVRTLTSLGYLYTLESQRALYPTRKLWDMASKIVAHDPLLERLTPAVEHLRNATAETVIVGKRQDYSALYLLVLEGLQTIRYVASAGRTVPLHTSAVGKALLSTFDEQRMDAWLNSAKLEKVTPNSIVDRAALHSEIRRGIGLGFFTTGGENVQDVGAIAMPVRIGGETLAIAVAGPTERVRINQDEIVSKLRGAIKSLANNTM